MVPAALRGHFGGVETGFQRIEVRHDQARPAAQALRLADGQVELALADIDPHIVRAGHQIGVARQPERGDVEIRRAHLVRHPDIDMLQRDDIADILAGAVELPHGAASLPAACNKGASLHRAGRP